MDLFKDKFQRIICRIGDIMIYEYSAFGLYLVRDAEHDGAWLYSSIEKAMRFVYKIKERTEK